MATADFSTVSESEEVSSSEEQVNKNVIMSGFLTKEGTSLIHILAILLYLVYRRSLQNLEEAPLCARRN